MHINWEVLLREYADYEDELRQDKKLSGANFEKDDVLRERLFWDHLEQDQVIERMKNKNKEMTSKNKELEKLVAYDALTGIYNRGFFDKEMQRIERAIAGRRQAETNETFVERDDQSYGLIMIDVDYFKDVNDKYGHLVGDVMLKKLADLVSKNIRPGDIFCRYGGEEFAIIAPAENGDLSEFADKIRKLLEEKLVVMTDEGSEVKNTVSIGATSWNNDGGKATIKQADDSLYAAKRHGRNCVYYLGDDGEPMRYQKDS